MVDFNAWLVKLIEEEYIHQRIAMENSPNKDDLSMRLKKFGGATQKH
ncbi:MAG: hypothetical protein ACFCBV_09350 [Phycisphaerales bacterium]